MICTCHLAGDFASRFWAKVDTSAGPDGCWPWITSRIRLDYGHIRRDGRQLLATHVAMSLAGREVPAGMLVCHTCDNPPCCNPAHLWVGTPAENVADRNAKGRQARGDRHGRARLTRDMVHLARALVAAGATQKAVAEQLGVRRGVIHDLINGRSWKHERSTK